MADFDRLTWAALLGHWVEFARSALALPGDAAGRRLRDSVPDIITLQAVWFALEHLDDLSDPQERALGLDRAELLISQHREALSCRFGEASLPQQLQELIDDAQTALNRRKREVSPDQEG